MPADLTPDEYRDWHARFKRFSTSKNLATTDADIDQLMQDSLKRGKSMAELLRKLEKKYGEAEPPPSRPSSKMGSRPPSRNAAPISVTADVTPPTNAGANTGAFDTSPQAERARWRSLMKEFCDEEGLGQTESDVEDLLIAADQNKVAYSVAYEKLVKRFRGYRAGAAALEEAAAVRKSRPSTPAVTIEAARDDPYFHRIARLLHFHRAFDTRADAEKNAAERIVAAVREKAVTPGAEVLTRVKAIYGDEPPASWVPPTDEERAALLASSAVLKAQAEALEAASAAAALKQAEAHGDAPPKVGKKSAAPSVAASKVSKRSGAAIEALNMFPGDAEAALYFVRIRNYCKHHRLGQSDTDVANLIREQRTKGKPLEKIIKKLVDRFGAEPVPSAELTAMKSDQERQNYFRRFSRLLQYYHESPTAADINDILDQCDEKGRNYDYVLAKMINKYGPEPPEDWIEAPLDAATQKSSPRRTPSRAASAKASKRESNTVGRGDASPRHSPPRASSTKPSQQGAETEPLTMRALAFSRLKRYALHKGWKRTDDDLRTMLDDAERRSGGYEAMFARLVKSFGPEPRGPGVGLELITGDPEEERLAAFDKLAVYCAHYGLKKTEKDLQKHLDDYASVGWDVMFQRLEKKFGPVPWANPRAVEPSTHVEAHWNAGGSAPSPNYVMDDLAAQRREMLRNYSQHFRLGWSDTHIASLVERHSHTFDALLSALERQHGPLPDDARNAVPLRAKMTAGELRRDGSNMATGAPPRGGVNGSVAAGDEDGVIKPAKLRQREVPYPANMYGEERERFRSEYLFWLDRVRNLFEVNNPAYANDEDVDELLKQYVHRGLSFERMWSELVAKYGAETPHKSKDSTRNYWKGKFKLYCDYYKMHKTDAELERMMDDFEPKGWARMYDRLVELHGPPPTLPATTAIPGIKMTPAQWRERLRNYCRTKFPTKTADEIDLYLDQFAEMNEKNLESLYATLVLLHGLERPEEANNASSPANPSINRELNFASPNAAAKSSTTPNVEKMVRDIAPPSRDFYEGKSVVRVFLTVSGFDATLYRGASPAHRQHLCTAVEQQLARALGLGDNQCYLQAVCPDSASQTTFDVVLSLTAKHDAGRVASQLVELVAAGELSMDIIKRSVMEDLNGNPFAIRAKDVTVSEVRSTAPPKQALSLDEQRQRALPLSAIELGNATLAHAPNPEAVHFASHRPLAPGTAATTLQSPPNTYPPPIRTAQGIHDRSARDIQPQFAEKPIPPDAPKPSRIKEILSTIGDFASAEAIQRDAALSLQNQPHNGEGPFVRRSAPMAPMDLTRIENPLTRLSDGAAAPSAMQLPFSVMSPHGPLYHSPSYGPVDYNDVTVVTPSATAFVQGEQGVWAANPRYPNPYQYPPLSTNATPNVTNGLPWHAAPEGRQSNPLAFLTPSSMPSPAAGHVHAPTDDAMSVISRVSSAAYALRRQRVASGSPPR